MIVLDNQNPTISCPANITATAAPGQCSTAVNYTVNAADNCSATVSVSPASGTVFQVGTTTVNATATDPAGNTATCSFTVTVNGSGGNVTWTGIPANATITCGTAVPAAPAIVPCGGGSSNNCPSNPVCYNGLTYLGDYNGSRYYRANSSSTWSSANNLAQSVGGQLVTISSLAENNWLASALGNSGSYWLGLNDVAVEGTFVWSSGSTSTYRNWNTGEPNNTNNEDYAEFIASNGKWNDLGNSNNCGSLKGIIEFPCSGSNGGGSGVSASAQCGPCPTVTMTQVTNAGSCAGNYTIVRTWTATVNGLVVGTQTQTITVVDNVAPVISCPANPCVSAANGLCSANVSFNATATDNCSGATITYSPASGSSFPVGTTPVVATATDGCGNTSTCSFNVIVLDNQNPVVSCPANISVSSTGANCNAAVTYNVTATDNCSATVTTNPASGSVFQVGTSTVTATATDPSGNTATCSFTVTVNAGCSASFTYCPADISVACQASCGNNTNGANVSWNAPTASSFGGCSVNSCPTNPVCYSNYTHIGDYNGSRYYRSNAINLTYAQAVAGASNLGGTLVTINNSAENTYLNNALTNSSDYWIGLNDATVEGTFVWSSGSSSSYRNWVSGEPNNTSPNFSGSADYTAWNAGNGMWYDRSNLECYGAIIEIPCSGSACNVTVTQTAGPASGSYFAGGTTTTITYVATASNGSTATCNFTVSVGECPLNYCNAEGSCSSYEWIKRVNLTNLDNWSGNDGGYADFTNYTSTVAQSGVYGITLRAGYASTQYAEFWRVYVDWNKDGDFNDTGEQEVNVNGVGTVTGSITVPSNATLGTTRMRVIMSRGCYASGPCGNFSYGEVEDYAILVTGPNARVIMTDNGATEDEADALAAALSDAGQSAGGTEKGENFLSLTNVFPVPTTDVLNVDFTSTSEGRISVQIFTVDGKLVMTEERDVVVDRNVLTLNVSQISQGTYFVKVHNGSSSFTEKFVKH